MQRGIFHSQIVSDSKAVQCRYEFAILIYAGDESPRESRRLSVNFASRRSRLFYGYARWRECVCRWCTKPGEYTEKNIRTDLDPMQEMVKISSQYTSTHRHRRRVDNGFDKDKTSEKLGL